MTKLPYGFDAKFPNSNDEPWTKLDTIVEYLQDGQPLPSDLSSWLGEAIVQAKRDPNEMLRRLGLKNRRGLLQPTRMHGLYMVSRFATVKILEKHQRKRSTLS
jgi:hypothetical protein